MVERLVVNRLAVHVNNTIFFWCGNQPTDSTTRPRAPSSASTTISYEWRMQVSCQLSSCVVRHCRPRNTLWRSVLRDWLGIEQHQLHWFRSYHTGCRHSRCQITAPGPGSLMCSVRLEDQFAGVHSRYRGHDRYDWHLQHRPSLPWRWLPAAHTHESYCCFTTSLMTVALYQAH